MDNSDKMWELLFNVRLSVRYHDRREGFYSGMHKLTNFICVVFGSATVITFLNGAPSFLGVALGMVVTFVSAGDLVFGFAGKGNLHNRLKRAFVDLEVQITRSQEDGNYNDYVAQRLLIEQDEPPKYHALSLVCYNDMVAASYALSEIKKHIIAIKWPQRLTAHLLPWGNIAHTTQHQNR